MPQLRLYQPPISKEQPREAFLLNAVYQLKAAAEEIERRKKGID